MVEEPRTASDRDVASLRRDIDTLTYRLAHDEIELTALKVMLAITFFLALFLPAAVYFAR